MYIIAAIQKASKVNVCGNMWMLVYHCSCVQESLISPNLYEKFTCQTAGEV